MKRVLLLIVATCCSVSAQSFINELRAEPNPIKRAEKALALADAAFDGAHDFYNQGDIHHGDAKLEEMTSALHECLESLDSTRKVGMYKKAELKVSTLQRRMQGLLQDIGAQERGWAEFTDRKLDEIHDKLLDGVMRK